MVDGSIELFLLNKVVTPFFFQFDNVLRKGVSSEFDGFRQMQQNKCNETSSKNQTTTKIQLYKNRLLFHE